MDSHVSYLLAEFIPEDGIAIAQQVHQKYAEDLETQGRHSKEIDRDQLLEVIVQEGAP